MALTLNLDLQDPLVYPGAGTTLLDKVTGAETYDITGIPITGTIKRLTLNGAQAISAVTTSAFATPLHKQNARCLTGIVFRQPTAQVSKFLYGNARGAGAGGAGFGVRIGSNGAPAWTVYGATGNTVLNFAGAVPFGFATGLGATTAPQVLLIGYDEVAGTGYIMHTAGMAANGNEPVTFAGHPSAYTTNAPDSVLSIGMNGKLGATKLIANTEIIEPAFCLAYANQEKARALFNTLTDRYAAA